MHALLRSALTLPFVLLPSAPAVVNDLVCVGFDGVQFVPKGVVKGQLLQILNTPLYGLRGTLAQGSSAVSLPRAAAVGVSCRRRCARTPAAGLACAPPRRPC